MCLNQIFTSIRPKRPDGEEKLQIYDEETFQQDKKMGVDKLAVNGLEPESPAEITLRLSQALDSIKSKDKKDRGELHLSVGS